MLGAIFLCITTIHFSYDLVLLVRFFKSFIALTCLQIDGGSHVTDMSFRTVNDVKNLFIATNTSLHSFPLERCSRLQGCR